MDISVSDIHNYMIKPSDNGGLESVAYSVTHRVLISETTSRSFITPQVRKMNPKLCQIYGCEICTVPKDMQVDINILRTIIIKYLKQKYVGIHTYNILFSTTSAANYKDKVFTYVECLHDTIKYAAHFITCLHVKPNNIIHIKCDLGFFMNVLITILPMKNYIMDQMLQ